MYIEENCAIEHDGQKFEAGGAAVTDTHLIGYVKGDAIVNWHGDQVIGKMRVISGFRVNSAFGSRMFCVRIQTPDGKVYSGRTFGDGMIVQAKRVKVGFAS